ncbi:hypothetical protein TeGR_g3083 [Tetraparma gracilis]|nr:hypothetical protein TeGR_g3083 [Tetraparma gracilis]
MVTSMKMPGAISNRVFANWWTWAEEQNGDLVAAFAPHEDYGPGAEMQIVDTALETAKRSVLGRLRGFYKIKTLAPNVCRVMLVAQGDAGGSITKQAMAWAVKYSLGMTKSLQDNVALGKAKATLDCSAKEACAYQVAACGREKMRRSRGAGDRARLVIKEQTKHDFEMAYVAKLPFPLTNREFLTRYLSFKKQTDDLVVVFEALADNTTVDYGGNFKVVHAKTRGFFRFKPINNDTQCEATLVQHGDAGGFVPTRVTVAKIPQALSGVAEMRELFQRDVAIDGAERSDRAASINTSKQPYLLDENSLVDEVGAKFASLPAFEELDSPDHFVEMSSVFKEWSSTATGRATTIVDAPVAEVAAWELAKMSRENQKGHVKFGGLDRNLKKINDHQDIFHVVYDLSIPTFLPRQFVSRIVWKWAADKKELTVVANSVEHTDFPERKKYQSASSTVMVKYKQEADVGGIPQTKVTWTQQVDLGGRIPKWVQNRQGVGQLMYLSRMRKRFDRSLELDGKKREELQRKKATYDKNDGRALGYRLTYPDEKNKKTPSEAVAHIVELHKGLSELSQEYPWIVAFLEEVLLGGLHRNKAVSTKLACLSEAEARKIGKNLPGALRARKTADAGVYQWKNQNPSMEELFEKYPWVEEMVLTMGEELLKNAAWGLWFRVITGSGLSMVDLATDINVIRVYFEEGQKGYGWMMLGMVLASLFIQLVIVVGQNGTRGGWGELLRELLIVVSGLKPGVDAMRVVSNAEMDEHHLMDAKMELVCTKGSEMFCESIPGCILQVTALIQGGSRDKMGTKILSIVVSAITTGMGSAAISYDYDSDPEKRRKLPDFYGYLPDDGNKRTLMYVCMVINSALLLLFRSIGAALLMLADPKIFVAYMAGDHLLYLLQKLARGDFLYWLPSGY